MVTTDVIEGEAREVEVREVEPEPIRALVAAQPGQAIVSEGPHGPEAMLAQASVIATALSRMVEDRKLFTIIRDRKYLQVEAWMTIGRMDNVVAREAQSPIKDEDGSWEAVVELVRLSDGMVIGRASAMCGAKGDSPWDSRPAHQRRSMAVTRATSRAFRQQYAWIVTLAGYEPTPADEMPRDPEPDPPPGGAAETRTTHRDGLIGKAIAQGTQDFELRQSPEGFSLPFRVKEGKLSQIVVAQGELALQLADLKDKALNQRITVWGRYDKQTFPKGGEDIVYNVLHADRIQVGFDVLPKVSPLREDDPEPIPVAEGQVDLALLDPEERLLVGGAG